MKKCVFSGTFDPPTLGHLEVVKASEKLFDEVVVAIMVNPEKKPYFTVEEREKLLKKLFLNDDSVKIRVFEGAAVDLLKEEDTPFYVRGVRNTIDFEYENQNYFANKKLSKDIVTIYIPCPQENIHISSTLVRNSIKFKKEFKDYIPEEILEDLLDMVKKKCSENR